MRLSLKLNGLWRRGRLVITAMVGTLLLALALQVSAQTAPAVDPTKLSFEERLHNARIFLRDNPISPPDTASPRATLESFRFIMAAASQIWLEVLEEYESSDSSFLTEEQKDQILLVQALLRKAARTMDLSGIPETSRLRASTELVLQLQEIMDRIPPLDFNEIPGETAGTFRTPHKGDNMPETWTLPGTSLKLVRQTGGERAGHYLFSRETVSRIPIDYALMSELPLRADRGEDLYSYYIYSPGGLIAPRWYNILRDGPEWLNDRLGSQAYWQWLAFFILVFTYLFGGGLYMRYKRRRAVSISERTRVLRALSSPIAMILSALLFRYLCEDQINISGTLLQVVGTICTAIVWVSAAWLVYRSFEVLFVWCIQSPTAPTSTLDASLLRTGFRLLSMGVSMLVLGYGATRIGIPVYGVVAGLGVGGLAIALAAQPTIENLIGGVILYADKMVRVGEFCQFDGLAGTVEVIGIRSTRIRAMDRTLITIANADLAKRKIVNYHYRDKHQFRHKIGLRYETEPATIRAIIDSITAYLETHPQVTAPPLRVRLISFDDFAQTIDVYTYVTASGLDEFTAIQQEMLLTIRDIISQHGSDFAFPSSTVYLGRDSGMPEAQLEDHSASSV